MGSLQGERCGNGPAERGYALIWALFTFVVAVGIVMSGSIEMMAHRRQVETDYHRYAQATQPARSGLTEAIGWFRKQSAQPVADFEPVNNPLATPPILDSDDTDIGIVCDFQITGPIWGRYEVWKDWSSDPDIERSQWRDRVKVKEISRAHQLGSGGAWRLRSVGFVYRLVDSTKPYNEAPNQVIATEILETDIRRMTLMPPGQAALNVQRGSNATINTNGRIYGGSTGAGIYYPTGTGSPSTGGASTTRVTGVPAMTSSSSYDDSYLAVFGVTEDVLQSMANDIVTDMASMPVPVPDDTLVFVERPSVHFDAATPLNSAAAIVVIKGNVVIEAGSMSNFSGLLYVDGNLTVRAPCEFRGSIVVTGNTTVQGSADFADIYYDDDVLNRLRLSTGNYRLAGAMRRPSL